MVDIPRLGQKWEKVELPPTPPMPEKRSSKHIPSHLSPFVHDPAIVQCRREGGRRPFPCVGYWPPVRPPPPLCATESQTEERLSYILYSSFVLFPFPFLFHSFSFHPGRRRRRRRRRRQLSSGLSIVASDAVTVEHKEDAPLPPPRTEASFPSLSTTTHAAAPPPPPPPLSLLFLLAPSLSPLKIPHFTLSWFGGIQSGKEGRRGKVPLQLHSVLSNVHQETRGSSCW